MLFFCTPNPLIVRENSSILALLVGSRRVKEMLHGLVSYLIDEYFCRSREVVEAVVAATATINRYEFVGRKGSGRKQLILS